ncbi:DNA cytosine methyltransferase [Pseudodesulfovibrio pelocollis]|uniref:DNA cytosine methyltransferase n=1 Tax=Pseudodesulfovibrio pelocollis TaxID=3051432 RepID=UPI003CE5602F
MRSLTVGSLFSGAGCGDLGLEWAGFDHAWFCEVDDYARKILTLRWPGKPVYRDIREVDFTQVEPVDLLAGGFPCQDISVAGRGCGIEGARSGLWSEFARAIAEIRPQYALIENSPALVGRGLDVVLSDLAALGYDAQWHCVQAAALGAPHKRDRIWIVGYASCYGRVQGRENHSGHDGAIPPADGQHTGEMAHANGERKSQSQGVQSEEWGRIGDGCGEAHIPDATGIGREPRRAEPAGQQRTARPFGHCSPIPHAMCAGCQELDLAALAARAGQRTGRAPAEWGEAWWAAEPELGRVAHGTPHRVDRLKCIGNGQVPHCTYLHGIMIREHARATGCFGAVEVAA